jgi:4-diphosphocytidyl-2-C-methyl-D-erythritol kinase
VVLFPFCKINLGLNIVSSRPDGYHNLETCFYPIPFTDILEAVHAPEFEFKTTGIRIEGEPEDNLCVKAYRLLAADYPIPPIYLHLHKAIPAGAGLAGGSSDAAHTLLLLNKKFNLDISHEKLSMYALQLGSDCPFFLHQQPMMGSGRGEELKPTNISLNGYVIALVMPVMLISTQKAFEGVEPKTPLVPISDILARPVDVWKDQLVNDFELSIFPQYTALAEIKGKLYQLGAVYASLTGTGSVVYGIFREGLNADEISGQFGHNCIVKIISPILK